MTSPHINLDDYYSIPSRYSIVPSDPSQSDDQVTVSLELPQSHLVQEPRIEIARGEDFVTLDFPQAVFVGQAIIDFYLAHTPDHESAAEPPVQQVIDFDDPLN